MRENEVVDAVYNWFRRKYGAGYFCAECVEFKGGRADLVYIKRADSIHTVEAKDSATKWKQAFRQLARYPGNYKWFAVPKDDYDLNGNGLASECSERGYGLLLVGGGSNHRIVIPRRTPHYISGRFEDKYYLS